VVLAAALAGLTAIRAFQRLRPAAAAVVLQEAHPDFRYRIDLNSATEEELALVPGIGEVRAREIVEHRWKQKEGAFEGIDDLAAIEGFSRSLINSLRPYLCVWNAPAAKAPPDRTAADDTTPPGTQEASQ